MRINTRKMSDDEFLQFLQTHPVSGSCGTRGAENQAAAAQNSFTSQMISEGTQVFGQDNAVFNQLVGNYTPILRAGPSQAGYSAAEDNALKAQIVQSTAVGARNVAAAAKAGVAGVGGGNTVMTSGTGLNLNAGIAENAMATQAGELNKEQIANWSQGHQNWLEAGRGLQAAPSVLSGASSFNSQAQQGLQQNMANAQAQDAASNWWAKDLTGAVMGGVSAFTGGIGGGLAKKVMGGGQPPGTTPGSTDDFADDFGS
jgi:hypothetical protein